MTDNEKIKTFIQTNPSLQYYVCKAYGFGRRAIGAFFGPNISYNGPQPFLFIVGAGRSGNTLLRKLLVERGDIYIPPESYVLSKVVSSHLAAPGLSWNDQVNLTLAQFEYHPEFRMYEVDSLREFAIYAKKLPEEKRQVGTIIINLYKWIAKQKGLEPVWVGDKTPLNTLKLGLIAKIFPRAAYIYIERDGVDVACSYVRAGIYTNLVDAAIRWKNSRRAWLKFRKSLDSDSFVEIRFKDLVENPEKIIAWVLDSLRLPRRVGRIGNITSILGDVNRIDHLSKVTKSVSTQLITERRSTLRPNERQILRSIIGNDLKNAGYAEV